MSQKKSTSLLIGIFEDIFFIGYLYCLPCISFNFFKMMLYQSKEICHNLIEYEILFLKYFYTEIHDFVKLKY